MRSEKEMLELLTDVARKDDRIRAAYLEGSRANQAVPRDIFQDYDVGYLVTDTKPFREDRSWIDQFGERLYMQYPEECGDSPSDVENCYGWLIQFTDGNRLDLHVHTPAEALRNLELYITLIDKDHLLPQQQMVSDERYWVKRPTDKKFHDTCNEFWWCLNNVAKGLWRDELPYVMDMLNDPVRPMLRRLLEWKAGIATDFSASMGKSGKYLKNHLPAPVYDAYLRTYPEARTDDIWDAVYTLCDLFQETAVEVSEKLGLPYDFTEAENSYGYLKHIRALPPNATEIY